MFGQDADALGAGFDGVHCRVLHAERRDKQDRGIKPALILTTASAQPASTGNLNADDSQRNLLDGDGDLNSLFGITADATVLSFDFEIDPNRTFFFRYVFASEEYNEFVGEFDPNTGDLNVEFNDVVGIFVDGQPIAQLPGTSESVAISTVNLSRNRSLFCDNEERASQFPTYDGFTVALVASLGNLQAGRHNLKLAIADGLDFSIDSAVFIESITEPRVSRSHHAVVHELPLIPEMAGDAEFSAGKRLVGRIHSIYKILVMGTRKVVVRLESVLAPPMARLTANTLLQAMGLRVAILSVVGVTIEALRGFVSIL